MKYVALLRGINVGGNSKVDMKRLKAVFEAIGMNDVRTYINSGNVVFSHGKQKDSALTVLLEAAIEKVFGFHVSVLVKSEEEINKVIKAIPDEWRNDQTMKCDVVFLWSGMDEKDVLGQLRIREGIDDVRALAGVIVWKVMRENATRSGLPKLIGTPAYKNVTIRNINTVRKISSIMKY